MAIYSSDHRQFYQFKLLILLLALLALVAGLSWAVTRGGGMDRLRGLLSQPTPTAVRPTLSAVQRVALTATAEAAQTAEAAAVQATATQEVAATETMVAIALATQTAKAMQAAEAATPTVTPVPTETPTPTPPLPTATETPAEATPPATETPEAAVTPGLTPTPAPAVMPPERVSKAATGPQEFQYTVGWGDTLTSLAQRFSTTADDIARRNNLADPDLIRVGQTLTVFGTPPAPPVDYVVQRGDTLWAIAIRFNTTVEAIARLNRIANPNRIWAGQTLRIVPGALVAPPDYLTYTVKRGDTLWAIALRHGTTAWAIAIVNNLANPHLIFVGQVLRIP